MGIVSKDIGVDLGTSNIRVYVKGRGIVLEEPSVVAINKITGEILSVGKQAKEMLGRTPDNIVALKPLKDGVIADFSATRMLLQSFISRVTPKSLFSKPRLVVSIPEQITDVEERAVEEAAYKAGAKDVYLMEETMAAAIGAGLKIEKPEGCMIVDIGGGTSEMAVLSLGGIVVSKSVKIAGEKLDDDIVSYIKRKYSVVIGKIEAEEVKKQIGSASTTMTEEKVSVKGRNLNTGLPDKIVITTTDVQEAISASIDEIVKAVKLTLEQTPPELSSDIMVQGVIISGGCAQIKNIDRYLSEQIGIPVHVAENPASCVIKGVGLALENIEMLKKSTKTKRG